MRKLFFLFTLTLTSCFLYNYKETTFKVVNDTAIDVDSAILNLPNYKVIVLNILSHSRKEINVPIDSLSLNNHELRMSFSAHFKGINTVLYGEDYTDLGGYPEKKYIILISNNSLRIKRKE